jgi:hypothetical protein
MSLGITTMKTNLKRHGFDSRLGYRIFFFNPSNRSTALVSTQPLTEIITRNLLGGKERPACMANNFNAIYEPTV